MRPSRREQAIAGGILAALMTVLFWVEAGGEGAVPYATILAGIAAFGLFSLTDLETGFLFVMVAAPFSTQVVFRGLGSALQIPTEPMLFTALAVWGLRFASRRSTTFTQPALTGALLLGFLACVVSFLDSVSRLETAKGTANVTWYALYGVFLLNNYARSDRLRNLTVAWLIIGAFLTLYSLVNVLIGHYLRWAGYFYASPFFADHGTFAAYLSFVFALALALTIELNGWPKAACGLLALLSGAQVVMTMTRGAWLGLVALAVFLLAAAPRRLFRPSNALLIIVGVLAVAGMLVFTHLSKEVEKHSSTITEVGYKSNLERINRWYAGWRMFLSDPLTGIGYNAYQTEYSHFRRYALSTDESWRRQGVHSEYLRILAETGILGAGAALLSLAALIQITLRVLRRTVQPFERAVALGLAGGLVTYMAHAVVNSYLEFDKVAIPVWTAIGALGALDTLNARRLPADRAVPNGR